MNTHLTELMRRCREEGHQLCYADLQALASTMVLASQQEVAAPVEVSFHFKPQFPECETPEPSIADMVYLYYRGRIDDAELADESAFRYLAAARVPVASPASREQGQDHLAVAESSGVPTPTRVAGWVTGLDGVSRPNPAAGAPKPKNHNPVA